KFNLLMGRELQRKSGEPEQIVLMTPILEGLDGVQKMSKSLGNAIGIKEAPADMYGKLMSISDDLMWKYWTFLTDLRPSEIDQMKADVAAGKLHPMEAKKQLARSIVADFHSQEEAQRADANWATQFQKGGVAEDLPVVKIDLAVDGLLDPTALVQTIRIAKLLHLAGLAASMGEANRKLSEKAVSLNGEKIADKTVALETSGGSPTLRLGKRAVRVEWVR
ncbi:MAG TPA: tyrosine--tRNA ligase, partial [Acidobacteriaceae bacterium]